MLAYLRHNLISFITPEWQKVGARRLVLRGNSKWGVLQLCSSLGGYERWTAGDAADVAAVIGVCLLTEAKL